MFGLYGMEVRANTTKVLSLRVIVPLSVDGGVICPVNVPAFLSSRLTWRTVFAPSIVDDRVQGSVVGHTC